jgi:hypothetical protein
MSLFKKRKKAVMKCWCHACNSNKRDDMGLPYALTHMILCPDCGNKRCPKASHHNLACTRSNEPGQMGSIY